MTAVMQSKTLKGPWGGMFDGISPKLLRNGAFVDALNTVVDAGRAGPRDGYAPARTTSLALAPRVFVSLIADDTSVSDIAFSGAYAYGTLTADGKILRADQTDGQNRTDIETGLTTPRAITAGGGYLWVAENDNEIIRRDLVTADNPSDVIASGLDEPWTLRYDADNDDLYWTEVGSSNLVQMCNAALAESAVDVSPDGLTITLNYGLGIDPSGNRYFLGCTESGAVKILRCDLGGLNPEAILTMVAGVAITGVDYDSASDSLFITTRVGGVRGEILKCAATGTPAAVAASLETLADAGQGLEFPLAMTVHSSSGRIHWSDVSGDAEGMFWTLGSAANFRVISSYLWKRSIQGVAAATFSDDLVLLQLLNEVSEEVLYAVWFPTTDNTYILPLGHTTPIADEPDMLVLNSRDADPAAGYDFQEGFGIANHAYMGPGLISGRGGAMFANGEGAFVFNYLLGNTTWQFAATGGSSGTWNITRKGLTSGTLNYDAPATGVGSVEQVLTSMAFCNRMVVSGGPLDAAPITVTFIGNRAGSDLTGIGIIDNITGATLTATKTVTGATEADHRFIMRPAGLPTPGKPTESASAAGNLDGYYDWKITFYSTLLGVESPASLASDQVSLSSQYRTIGWTVPSTLWFDTASVPDGELIDKVKIYRRRWGSSAGADGLSASSDWYYVGEEWVSVGSWVDNVADGNVGSVRVPKYGYTPDDAQFAAIHNGRSYFMPLGDALLSWSELPNALTGELGFEYVLPASTGLLENDTASDHHATGLVKYGSDLLAFTAEDAFVLDISRVAFGQIVSRRLEGAAGCASQNCIVRTRPMPELGGRLIWPDSQGNLYEFAGGQARLLSAGIVELIKTLTKQTWTHLDSVEIGQDTWYFASAVLDPEERRIIISTFLDDGAASRAPIQLVYDLITQSWSRWDIPAWSWMVLREWSGATGKGRPVLCFSDDQANLLKMTADTDDNGTDIDWHLLFGEIDAGGAMLTEQLPGIVAQFDLVGSGSAPTVSLQVTPDKKTPSTRALSIPTNERVEFRVDARGVHIQPKLFGTIASGDKRPFLTGLRLPFEGVNA